MTAARWYGRASDLLRSEDAGPTPYLVDELIVDKAIAGVVGAPKLGKTWLTLELGCAIVTGRPALGRYAVPKPGPVLLVLEESGEAALHRRLDALARGHGLDPGELDELYYAANRRVRLDEPDWQKRLEEACDAVQPRAVFLDPLARLKGASRDENAQKEIAPVLDFMRDLRHHADAAIVFVHHVGHGGDRMRGSSDLEAYWESKLTLRKGEDGHLLSAEHREAETAGDIRVRFNWHAETRTVRLTAVDESPEKATSAEQAITRYIAQNPGASKTDLEQAKLGIGTKMARSVLARLLASGTVRRAPTEKTDRAGRPVRYQGLYLASQAALRPVWQPGTDLDGPPSSGDAPFPVHTSIEVDGGPGHGDGLTNETVNEDDEARWLALLQGDQPELRDDYLEAAS
jgi:hypothetical protein